MTALTPLPSSTALDRPRAFNWKKAANDWQNNLGSDRTRRAYAEAWAAFLTFTNKKPEAIDQGDVIEYRRHLETDPSPKTLKTRSQATINLHLTALSSFFEWSKVNGLRADNPVDGVGRKSVTPYGKATLLDPDQGEDLKLLEAVDLTKPTGLRDRAIILLFLTWGLRVESLTRLKVGDLRRQGEAVFMTVTVKGNKTRDRKLPAETVEAIDDYLKTRDGLTDASPLFTAGAAGRAASRRMLEARGLQVAEEESTMTPRAIAYLVKSYCDKAFGKGHGIHPHSLRHTAAKIAEASGHRLTEIGDLLGHASIQVTTIYMHATSGAADKVAATLGRRYSKTAKGKA